jgi:hypothetical protein
MKRIILFSGLFFYSLNGFSQRDKMPFLKNFSGSQSTLGYEGIFFGPNDFMNGMAFTVGTEYKNKIFVGIDGDAAKHHRKIFLPGETYPQTENYLVLSLAVAPLIHPEKRINFSFPVKFGIGTATRWDTTTDLITHRITTFSSVALNYPVYEYPDNFFVASAGANCFVNLSKPWSLGVGAGYRYAILTRTSQHANNYSGISIFILVKYRIDGEDLKKRK